jgi:hypothetical protein
VTIRAITYVQFTAVDIKQLQINISKSQANQIRLQSVSDFLLALYPQNK